jgi:hypothetical protein
MNIIQEEVMRGRRIPVWEFSTNRRSFGQLEQRNEEEEKWKEMLESQTQPSYREARSSFREACRRRLSGIGHRIVTRGAHQGNRIRNDHW